MNQTKKIVEKIDIDKDFININFNLSISPREEDQEWIGINGDIDECGYGCIGKLELVQFNFSRIDYSWIDLVDEVDDDTLITLKPILDAKNCDYSEEFLDILDGDYPDSVIEIKRIFVESDFRGNNLLGAILKIIQNFKDCPIVLTPCPLQHANGTENWKIMGKNKRAKRSDFNKDFQKLYKHYEKHGFKRIKNSKTWVLP